MDEIPVLRRVLEKNDHAAQENRALFDQHGIRCINLLGGAGCGKTALLEGVLPRIRSEVACAVLEGDLATTNDGRRIAALDVPVVQLLTEGSCHLSAVHVQHALRRLDLNQLDLLIIENVGNPVCPANFDLGEHSRIAVLSVAEGDDKPEKYPLLFRDAQLIVLTKSDLLPYVNFDMDRTTRHLRRLNAAAKILQTGRRVERGFEEVAAWLASQVGSLSRI
jgi:hydrogenase nickel incorporation protein HypB